VQAVLQFLRDELSTDHLNKSVRFCLVGDASEVATRRTPPPPS
jgi:hypothetical protein